MFEDRKAPTGVIRFTDEGNPICEICGKSFKRILCHVRQKHEMTAKGYKQMFGLDTSKGICSSVSSEKTRVQTLKNYQKCIKENLLQSGVSSRFKKGSEGRIKISEQTRIRLKKRLKEQYMVDAMKKSGRKVGLSGLGNLKRWGKVVRYTTLNQENV
jgi:hypothetical protein